jgi:hypothetical protein
MVSNIGFEPSYIEMIPLIPSTAFHAKNLVEFWSFPANMAFGKFSSCDSLTKPPLTPPFIGDVPASHI